MSTDDITPTPSVDTVARLPSLDAIQAAHKELLQAHRQEGDTSEMLDRIEAFIYQGQATGAVLDAEDDRWTAQGMLDYWSATLFRAARRAPDATLADFDPNLAPVLPDELCPYVGLDPFREATQTAFFGRERLVATLVEKLADSRLLVVSGPSGSGKSSVVLAGLLPALQRGALPGSESWRYVPRMVPGSNPLVNLVRLIEAAGDGTQEDPVAWAQQQEKLLCENPNHLLELVNATGESPVVGVVDQFEEAFTLCNDQQVRQAFIDNLVNLVRAPGVRHTVILTIRTDFEPRVTRLPEFYALFEQALVRVTPLSASELREAIEKPASKIGLKFEAGLVDQLLQDLLGEPAGLPLLQFTLLKLWENRTRNRITWAVYNRLGGGRLALARSADAFYDELIPEEQLTAKRIFLRLVQPGEGLEFTSNRVRLRTLYQAGEAQYRVDRVVDKLIIAHLLRRSEGDVAADIQVEVAHEALVRNWPTLVTWLEEERHNIRRRQSVNKAAERWIMSGRDPGALYTTETLLQEALGVIEASGVPQNEQEAEFIHASQVKQEATQQEQAAARKRIRTGKVALAIATVITLLACGLAFLAASAAQQSRDAAEAEGTAVAERGIAVIAMATADAAVVQQEAAYAARTTAEAGATQVAANLQIAKDALDAQIGFIDQVETVEAEKAVLSAQVRALETVLTTTASPSAPVPTLTPTTPRPMTGPPTPAQTTSGTRTVTQSSSATPARTTTPIPTRTPGSADVQSATVTAVALATLRSQVQATQTAIVTGAAKSPIDLYAVIPNIILGVRSDPSEASATVARVQAPDILPVLEISDNSWVKLRTETDQEGWLYGHWLTFEGDPDSLPADLSYRRISDRTDLPFVFGKVVSHDGVQLEYPLLKDPRLQDTDTNRIALVPIGTEVTVLAIRTGQPTYGSSQWYVVTVEDPEGRNFVWTGYLPVEAVNSR